MTTGSVLRSALRRSPARIRHVTPVRAARAGDRVGRIHADIEREFGMLAPPVVLHSPAPDPLAACWVMLRETLVATGTVDRSTKEAVATAVSVENSCPYCAEVHGLTRRHLTRGSEPGGGIGARSRTDPVMRAASEWIRTGGGKAPFDAGQLPEVLGVAVTFHYLNRMVNVFLDDSPLPSAVPQALRRGAAGMLGRFLATSARRHCPPGGSLDLLPSAPLPRDFSWAAGVPSIADAFARASAALDTAGERTVPAAARELVSAELDRWDGRPTGPSRGWVHDAVAGLPPGDRPAARLALLTAMASYQVDEAVIEEFRRLRPDDASLIELTSWAAFAAARRRGTLPAGGNAGTASTAREV